jgi:2-C-methyl-D-erythritol 4-phosphate cytidylyltransferase
MAAVSGAPPATPTVVAVILGAGQGTRLGADRNKILLDLYGKPILVHALDAFARTVDVSEILLVAHPREVTFCEHEIVLRYSLRKVKAVIPGGATRHQSEACALAWLRPRIESGEIALILIHDGARPLITPAEISAVIAAAREVGGAILAGGVAADETLLELAEDGTVRAALLSAELARAQTPQAFEARMLLEAFDAGRAAGFEGTDTAASVERLGRPIAVVRGGIRNLKITTPNDLARAEALLA